MSLLTCHAFFPAQGANSTNTCLAMKNSQPYISQILVTLLANWKAKVMAKAAVDQMCLKHSIFLLGNLTHLLLFPEDKGCLAHLPLKEREQNVCRSTPLMPSRSRGSRPRSLHLSSPSSSKANLVFHTVN